MDVKISQSPHMCDNVTQTRSMQPAGVVTSSDRRAEWPDTTGARDAVQRHGGRAGAAQGEVGISAIVRRSRDRQPRTAPHQRRHRQRMVERDGRAGWSSGMVERGSVVLGFEPAFGVDRRHATAAGGGDRLAVRVILDVAAGEHAVDVGVGRVGLGDQVARVRPCRARRRTGRCWDGARWRRTARSPAGRDRSVDGVGDLDAVDLVVAVDLGDRVFQRNSIFGLAKARSCMILRARSSSRRWIDGDLVGELGEEGRLLDRRVAATDDGDLVAAEEEPVAGGAGRQTVADQTCSARGRASATGPR